MLAVCFLVALGACIIGSICGMGGGVIIKPVLDATGLFAVSTINFMSGCTVLGMSCWNVGKTLLRKESAIDLRKTTVLAISAAVGGITGKILFRRVQGLFPNPNTAGGVQAVVLLLATFATLLYTIKKDRIASKETDSLVVCALIGFALGNLGSFLGIGGGPFNLAVLYYFFSMKTKPAAQNSLYIILFSQAMSLLSTVSAGGVPDFEPVVLLGMIACGILGSEVGRRINKGLTETGATRLFEASMILVMLINVYNIVQFL